VRKVLSFGFVFLAGLLSAPAVVRGHGVQYQLSYDSVAHRIQTHEIVSTTTTPLSLTGLKRIYVMPLVLAGSPTPAAQAAWYSKPDSTTYASGNGICYQWDAAAPSGGQVTGSGWSWTGSGSLPNLAGTSFGYQFTDRLLKWDGAAFTAAAAGAVQLQAFRGDAATVPTIVATTASGAMLPFSAVNSVTQSTNPHANAGFRLLGDGASFDPAVAGAGTDGIYLQGMQVTSTAAGVAASDPLYAVLYKNVTPAAAVAAAVSFAASQGIPSGQIQTVPEPAGLAATGFAVIVASWWYRGRIGRRR